MIIRSSDKFWYDFLLNISIEKKSRRYVNSIDDFFNYLEKNLKKDR